jgi:hypothetical protein
MRNRALNMRKFLSDGLKLPFPPPPPGCFSLINTAFHGVSGPFHEGFSFFLLHFVSGIRRMFPQRGNAPETALINSGGLPPQIRKRRAASGWRAALRPSVFIRSGLRAGMGSPSMSAVSGAGQTAAYAYRVCLRSFAMQNSTAWTQGRSPAGLRHERGRTLRRRYAALQTQRHGHRGFPSSGGLKMVNGEWKIMVTKGAASNIRAYLSSPKIG